MFKDKCSLPDFFWNISNKKSGKNCTIDIYPLTFAMFAYKDISQQNSDAFNAGGKVYYEALHFLIDDTMLSYVTSS